jgi:hypothetical protein
VLKTIATANSGIAEFWTALLAHNHLNNDRQRKLQMMTEKAFQLILQNRMSGIKRTELLSKLSEASNKTGFNLYQFLYQYYFQS